MILPKRTGKSGLLVVIYTGNGHTPRFYGNGFTQDIRFPAFAKLRRLGKRSDQLPGGVSPVSKT